MTCLVCGTGEPVPLPAESDRTPAAVTEVTYLCPLCRQVGGVTAELSAEYELHRRTAAWFGFALAIRQNPKETDRKLIAADYWQDRGFDALAVVIRGTPLALTHPHTARGYRR